MELVRTRKNWILKTVLSSRQIAFPASYQDFLRQTELSRIVLDNLHEDQETDILPWIVGIFGHKLENISPVAFEKELKKRLGFGQED